MLSGAKPNSISIIHKPEYTLNADQRQADDSYLPWSAHLDLQGKPVYSLIRGFDPKIGTDVILNICLRKLGLYTLL